MKAVGYRRSLPVTDESCLIDVDLPEPRPTGRDLLVRVRAVSVNPVDTKVRRRSEPPAGEVKVLGWDAAGVVEAVGPEAVLFAPGDEVWYAGSITRPGSNTELQLVDERIVGPKPRSLDPAAAAALPLTSITAWELLFDRLGMAPGKRPTDEGLLIVGAGGGVGSILTQLARRLTGLTVIGTASRAETREWVLSLGAHYVIDHGKPLSEGLRRIGIFPVSHVAALTRTDLHWPEIAASVAPQGRIGLIDDPGAIDILLLKQKSVSVHWEFMFTRSQFETPDMIAQHRLLSEVADLVDAGVLRTTVGDHLGRIEAESLRRAHAVLECGKARGKIVLEGF